MGAALGNHRHVCGGITPTDAVLRTGKIFTVIVCRYVNRQGSGRLEENAGGRSDKVAAVKANLGQCTTGNHTVFRKGFRLGREVEAGQCIAIGEGTVLDFFRICIEGSLLGIVKGLLTDGHQGRTEISAA